MILYAPDYRDSLWKVNANGGTPERVTKLDLSKHSTHRWPTFLPDGKHFLFYATNHAGGRREDNGVYMGSLDGDATRLVLATDSSGLYSSGYLLYHQQNALVAQKFDPDRGTLSGDPTVVANDVQHDSGVFHTRGFGGGSRRADLRTRLGKRVGRHRPVLDGSQWEGPESRRRARGLSRRSPLTTASALPSRWAIPSPISGCSILSMVRALGSPSTMEPI